MEYTCEVSLDLAMYVDDGVILTVGRGPDGTRAKVGGCGKDGQVGTTSGEKTEVHVDASKNSKLLCEKSELWKLRNRTDVEVYDAGRGPGSGTSGDCGLGGDTLGGGDGGDSSDGSDIVDSACCDGDVVVRLDVDDREVSSDTN